MVRALFISLLINSLAFVNAFADKVDYPDSAVSASIINLIHNDRYSDAIQQLNDVHHHFESISPTREYIRLLINVAAAFNEKGDYGYTQQYSFMALSLAVQEDFEDLKAEALIDIGYTYYFLEQLEKGVEYGEQALALTKKLNLVALSATANNLLGILHAKMGHDSNLVMNYYAKALELRKQQNDARGVASTTSNIGLELERQNRFDEALVAQKRSLRIDDSIGNEYGAAWSYQMIGSLLIKMKRFEEANKFLTSAEGLSKKLKAREILLQTYRNRSAYLAGQSKFEEALRYSNLYNDLRDSIYNAGLTSKVTFLQQSFETRERDQQIARQRALLEVQKFVVIIVIVAIVLVLIILFFYYRSYKKTLSLNREITEQNEEIQTQAEELTEANQALQVLNRQIAEQKEELQSQAEELVESNATILSLNEQLNSDIAVKKDELVKTNDELVKHNNELLQFSFTVSHNLRGPVARMLGLMNLISISNEPTEKTNYIELLQRSTIELDTILRDLNLIIDTRNGISKVREKIFLNDEWRKGISLLQDYIKPDFTITTDFTSVTHVYAVRAMIQNIFFNLISNAIRYRSADRSLNVEVSAYRVENATCIKIKDNGLGIDLASHGDSIFKLYKRFHTHVAGKGLGLYLIKTQLETLGGSIAVESEINKGTTFTISLPDVPNMDEQVLLENEAAKLFYDANTNNTVIIWKRLITSAEYHQVFENVLQTLRTYNTPAWIADLRSQGVVSEIDQKWFMNTVLPQAVECGLKRIATIGFTDPVREVYYKNMQLKTKELGIDLKVFDSMDSAKCWIESYFTDQPVIS